MTPVYIKIPLDKCEDRRCYRIYSRNLRVGVFRKETGGFIGIRTKFGDRYLFEEYHWDTGAPFGTVRPQEALAMLPDNIRNSTSGEHESVCSECNVPVGWREDSPNSGTGVWYHLGPTECSKVRPMGTSNHELFAWLEAVEKDHGHEER